jgi:hypothetical protein
MNTITESVKSILSSNAIGVGKTTDIAETFIFEDDNTLTIEGLGSFKLSNGIQKAKLIQMLASEGKKTSFESLGKTLRAMELEFLGVAHQNNAGKETKTVSKPIPTGSNITSDDYLKNAVTLNLANVELADELLSLDTAVIALDGEIPASATKADITKKYNEAIELLKQYQTLFITETNRETYSVMVDKEQALAAKFKTLADDGFTNILPAGDSLTAYVDVSNAKDLQNRLTTLGYSFINADFLADKGVISVYFKELPKVETETEPA